MDVGIYLDLRNPPQWERPWAEHYARSLELVEEAERLGAASVWLSEHHFFEDGYLPQPLTFAAAVAARTRRLRIGTAVLLAALRRPAQLAEEAAVVDILSGGRLEVGVGVGYRVPEFDAFGADIRRRYPLVEDTVREVLRLWDGVVTPPPVQQPIPVWGGFFGPRGAAVAGRLGIGLLAVGRELYEVYSSALEASTAPRNPAAGRVKASFNLVVADDPEAAWERIRPHYSYQWDTYRRYMVEGTDQPVPRPIDPDAWRQGREGRPPHIYVVTPDDAVGVLRKEAEGLPVDELFCWASVAGMPDDLVQRHVELLCTVVGPALR